MEIWKTVPSLPQYEVSSEGRVRHKPYWAAMHSGGYRLYGGVASFGSWSKADCRFMIFYRGKNYKVARMVCEAFHGGPPTKKSVVMHKDESAANNRPDNLVWGTQKENLNHPRVKAYHAAVCAEKMKGNSVSGPRLDMGPKRPIPFV